MAITVINGHVSRALDFFNKFSVGGIWFAVGQKDAWPDDTNPPAPTVNITDVNEIVGFKQAGQCNLVINAGVAWVASTPYNIGDTCMSNGNIYQCTVSGTSGTTAISGTGASITDGTVTWKYILPVGTQIVYNNINWQVIPPNQAVQYQAKSVFLSANLNGAELPLTTYRQVGIYTGTQLASGVPSGTVALIPSQVSSNGILEVVENRTPVNRASNQKETLSVVIQF